MLFFQLARRGMGEEEFSKVVTLVPEIGQMLASVPRFGGISESRNEVASSPEERLETQSLTEFVEGFLRLGMDCTVIGRFVPLILSYVRRTGGREINGLSENDLN